MLASRGAQRAYPFGLRERLGAFSLAAAAFVAVIVTNLIDLKDGTFGIRLLDANWRFSWSHDLNTLILAAGVVAAAKGARNASNGPRLWRVTAVVLGLFFLDEASSLHAEIDRIPFGKVWYSPLLLVLVVCLWSLARDSDERVVVSVGLITLFVSFAMHVAGLKILSGLGYLSVPYQLGVGIKEGTETAGLLLIVPALWRLVGRNAVPLARAATRAS